MTDAHTAKVLDTAIEIIGECGWYAGEAIGPAGEVCASEAIDRAAFRLMDVGPPDGTPVTSAARASAARRAELAGVAAELAVIAAAGYSPDLPGGIQFWNDILCEDQDEAVCTMRAAAAAAQAP